LLIQGDTTLVIWDTTTVPTHTIEALQQKAPSTWTEPVTLIYRSPTQTQWERLEDTTQELARR
jgi:hypothetical protein